MYCIFIVIVPGRSKISDSISLAVFLAVIMQRSGVDEKKTAKRICFQAKDSRDLSLYQPSLASVEETTTGFVYIG